MAAQVAVIVISVALVAPQDLNLTELTEKLRTRLAGYKLPRKFKLLKELPRNAMGKVIKSEVKKLFNSSR